jgi:Ca2+-binding RTX toxin-like protein
VTVTVNGGTASGGDAAGDILTTLENLIGSSNNDTLAGDAGNNILDGALGSDTASFASTTLGVTATAGASATGQGSDTLPSIENLTGGTGGDVLNGDANVNVIDGGLGNDTIDGAAGNDTLIGGDGTDR